MLDYEKWTMLKVDFQKTFGLKYLNPQSLNKLSTLIENDKNKAIEYLCLKAGFDPSIEDGLKICLKMYQDGGYLSKEGDITVYLCTMHSNMYPEQMEKCWKDIKGKNTLFQQP